MPAATGALAPHILKEGSISIGATDFANIISKSKLVPSQDIVTFTGYIPEAVYQDVNTATWVWQITAVASWAAGGLAKLLHENAGMELDCVFTPNTPTGESASFTIMPTEVPFGGDQGTFNVEDMIVPVIGQPNFTDGDSSSSS